MSPFDDNNLYGQDFIPYRSYQESAASPKSIRAHNNEASSVTRMTKQQALAFVRKCKGWLIAASVLVFGLLSTLIANQLNSTASASPASPSNTTITTPSTGPASPSNTNTTTPPQNGGGGFFQQQQGGYDFGNDSGQPPVSNSQAS